MCEPPPEIVSFIFSVISGLFFGYLTAFISRRISDADAFCDLVQKEICAASELHDNIEGDHCISNWLAPSQRRIAAYVGIVDWKWRIFGQSVIRSCEDYQKKTVSLQYRREDIVVSLTRIYRAARKST